MKIFKTRSYVFDAMLSIVLLLILIVFPGFIFQPENIKTAGGKELKNNTLGNIHDGADRSTEQGFYAPENWGPYGVGYIVFNMIDNNRDGRHVPVVLYYPSESEPVTDINAVTYNMNLNYAAADSAALPNHAAAPYPLIVFSHGQSSSKRFTKSHNEFMASHGYVVIACDHIGSTLSDSSFWPADPHATVNRVLDVLFILDELEILTGSASFLLHGMCDCSNAGMCGHSYGGSITALMSGAILTGDTATFDLWEKVYWKDNQDMEIYKKLPDARIKAALSMSGDGAQRFYGPDGKGYEPIQLPFMYMGGKLDNIIGYEPEAIPCFNSVSGPAYLLTFLNEGHVYPYIDPPGNDVLLTRNYRTMQRYACAFWNLYLKQDERYARYFSEEETALWNNGYDDFTLEIRDE